MGCGQLLHPCPCFVSLLRLLSGGGPQLQLAVCFLILHVSILGSIPALGFRTLLDPRLPLVLLQSDSKIPGCGAEGLARTSLDRSPFRTVE